MKVFAIRDEEEYSNKDLAYLIYYEADKRFYIELPDDADPWGTPLLLASFAKKGYKTINSYWSRLWVQQRIVPTDRQNLGQVLKDNALTEYNEFDLLMLGHGRCAQDSYYLVPIDEAVVLKKFGERYAKKVEDVIPLNNNSLLVFFRNGEVKRCDINNLKKDDRFFKPVLASKALFDRVSVQTGGYSIYWGENAVIPDSVLYDIGINIPLCMDDFISFLANRVISTAEAAKLLNCTRQNISDLVARDKLHPVKTEDKIKFFLKSEIMQRMWK